MLEGRGKKLLYDELLGKKKSLAFIFFNFDP